MGTEVTLDELRLAARNHALPLEALRYDVTPIGLHYLLTHYDIPAVDESDWALHVDGLVDTPLRLTLADLQAMPSTTRRATMECAGNGRALLDPRPLSQPWLNEAVGTGEWTGVPLDHVLALAGVRADAIELVFRGADSGCEHGVEEPYERSLTVDVARRSGALLAYALNGTPLPPQHGHPLRLIVPRWYGMTNVKWLTNITAVDVPFAGFHQAIAYRVRYEEGEDGEPLTHIRPRALMIPPGVPEFFTRSRIVDAGQHVLRGRAWSGGGAITSVAVSTDAGNTWSEAEVEPALQPGVWQGWTFSWTATAGATVLCCRATDATGATQPITAEWNLGGYVNNSVQRVPVDVR